MPSPSACAAGSGALYAHYAGYFAPNDFDLVRSVQLLAMLIVGGETSIPGTVLGAVIMTFAPEWLRFLGESYLVAFSAFLLLVLILLPQGLGGGIDALLRRCRG